MTTVPKNLRAIDMAVRELNVQSIAGRNDALRDYHGHITPEVREDLTYAHSTQIYANKTLGQFLELINKRPIHMPVKFLGGGDDNALLAKAANAISNIVYQRALAYRDTGRHLNSLNVYIREVGGSALIHLQTGKVSKELLPDRAIVSIVPVVEYANTLESRGVAQGILYYAAKQARAMYGQALAIKFDYISGPRIGENSGTFPRIQIGHFGNLKPGLKAPGSSGRRRRRRGYAQAKGRQA